MSSLKIVTSSAPMNMAVIKYWGKRDEELVLPINSSLSATLCPTIMCSTTTVCTTDRGNLRKDTLWLNGKEETITKRLQECLRTVRKLAAQKGVDESILESPVHICSVNNFPTAAGLASSAAGFAALVAALCQLYDLDDDQSKIARKGSGSACRSTKGGWVMWHKGVRPDGEDSIAEQIAPENHWPEMRVLILVVDDTKKKTSSTGGMKDSVKTSELLKYRSEVVVPERIKRMKRAILDKDFETFAEITMKDSNQFHAICMDTYPPFAYLNETSHAIIDAVHEYNKVLGKLSIAYTFDAGPNACLFMLEDQIPFALTLVEKVFPSGRLNDPEYVHGMPATSSPFPPDVAKSLSLESCEGKLRYLIHTKVGSGPTKLHEHLLDESGNPKSLS